MKKNVTAGSETLNKKNDSNASSEVAHDSSSDFVLDTNSSIAKPLIHYSASNTSGVNSSAMSANFKSSENESDIKYGNETLLIESDSETVLGSPSHTPPTGLEVRNGKLDHGQY